MKVPQSTCPYEPLTQPNTRPAVSIWTAMNETSKGVDDACFATTQITSSVCLALDTHYARKNAHMTAAALRLFARTPSICRRVDRE